MANYLYNNIELPQIPASTSPVAVISSVLESASSMFGGASYIVTFGASILWSGGKCYVSGISGVYRYDGSAWVWHYGSGTTYTQDIIASGYFDAVWTNTNIPTADGVNVYLAATEPVPVGGDSGGGSGGEEEETPETPEYTIDDVIKARREGFITGLLTGLSIKGVLHKKSIAAPVEADYYLYGTPSESGNVAIAEGEGYVRYEGAVLPNIGTVYTDELKAEYPYVYMRRDWDYQHGDYYGVTAAKQPPVWNASTNRYDVTETPYIYTVLNSGDTNWHEFQQSNSNYWVKSDFFWTNYDLTLHDGSVLPATAPPLVSNEPVAAVYGGEMLPLIDTVYTEELKATHPYAIMYTNAIGKILLCTSVEFYCDGENITTGANTHNALVYLLRGAWIWQTTSGEKLESSVAANAVFWTLTNILNADNTTYLAASDPIPVYEEKE